MVATLFSLSAGTPDVAGGAGIERQAAAGGIGVVIDRRKGDVIAGSATGLDGDVVVTSGTDDIYPKGFVLGLVTSVERGTGLYKAIQVDPVVDFSRLEDVLIVMTPWDDGVTASLVAGGYE